jgi:BlaI family transcriptional regulator, penicillinase repressor
MTMKPEPKPTEAELAILRVLWDLGPSSVREVHVALRQDKGETGYTTTLKLLQLMHGKGLVLRNDDQRAHIYATAASQQSTEKQLVGDLMSRLFGGSASRLVLQALGTNPPANPEELAAIKALIARIEQGQSA